MKTKSMYEKEWAEFSDTEKTDKIIALLIDEKKNKVKAIMDNVSDLQGNALDGIHECDVLELTMRGYGIEFAVIISKEDLLFDLKKTDCHKHKLIKQTYFVIPSDLVSLSMKVIPKEFGLIEYVIGSRKRFRQLRKARMKESVKWNDSQIFDLYKKGYNKYLTIKQGEV